MKGFNSALLFFVIYYQFSKLDCQVAGAECKCIPIDQCNYEGSSIVNFRGVNDCEDYLEICCHINLINYTSPENPNWPSWDEKRCGVRNPSGIRFQITGNEENESQYAEFPWMIGVYKQNPITLEYEYEFGGSLIHPSIVMTVSHRVHNANARNLRVRAGEWDRLSDKEPYAHQDRFVAEVVPHARYNSHPKQVSNNIALLFLEQPMNPTKNVDLIMLPPQNQDFYGDCVVTGWGKSSLVKQSSLATILKKITLPIVHDLRCEMLLKRAMSDTSFRLGETILCAGGDIGIDTCEGDGGSPLICPVPGSADKYYQAGIVSQGIGCGENNVPGMYTKVSQFRNWIDRKMADRGFVPYC